MAIIGRCVVSPSSSRHHNLNFYDQDLLPTIAPHFSQDAELTQKLFKALTVMELLAHESKALATRPTGVFAILIED